jgi:polar amino acid transport system substrate-binding protein
MSSTARAVVVLATLLPLLLPLGCGISVPADPDGTLDRVESSGVLRAGAAPHRAWVEVGGSGRPTGHEVSLVEDFAQSVGARVVWTVGTEEHLVTLFEEGELDLWVDKVALTRPYAEVTAAGTTEKHVMMTPMGENAWLSELERWLDEHGSAP